MANKLVYGMAALALLGTLAAPAWAQDQPPAQQPPAQQPPPEQPPAQGDTTNVNIDQGPSFYGVSGMAFWVMVLIVVVILALLLFALAAGGHHGPHH